MTKLLVLVLGLAFLYGLMWFLAPHLLDPFLALDRGSFRGMKAGAQQPTSMTIINERWALRHGHKPEGDSFIIYGKDEEHNICMYGEWTSWQIQCRLFPGQARAILEQVVAHPTDPEYGLSGQYELEKL